MVSIDYERRWGVIERPVDGPYAANLLGVPASVRGTLALFREFEIAATWATVGFLLARTREERERFSPRVRPRYGPGIHDPYRISTGEDEASDPFHYGASLIPEIMAVPRQELATHTFSHLYCLARGVTKEAFRADLESAIAITEANFGVRPRSIVFPRNQHNPGFDDVLRELGVHCYRGNPGRWLWRPGADALPARALRLVDSYVPIGGMHTLRWSDIPQANGMFNVPASFLLRPRAAGLRLRRISDAIRHAARRGELVHLWWHPHNFGRHTAENMESLRRILEEVDRCRDRYGMQSLSMMDSADQAAHRHAIA